jgi:hypothetical protein
MQESLFRVSRRRPAFLGVFRVQAANKGMRFSVDKEEGVRGWQQER